jgi:glycerophosphodiester phosphodiesterase
LRRECDIVRAFLATQTHDIDAQISSVKARWGTGAGLGGAQDYHGVSKLELDDLQASLLAAARQIIQLDSYMRINYEALSRLQTKAASVFGLELPPELLGFWETTLRKLYSPCVASLVILNKALEGTGAALEDGQDGMPSRSLLLEQYTKHAFSTDIIRHLWKDDGESFGDVLSREYMCPSLETPEQQSLLRRLLQVAIVYRSSACQQAILPLLRSSHGDDKAADQDYLHRIVQKLGQSRSPVTDGSSPVESFRHILDLLHPSQRFLLQSSDRLGRLPLHYAAALGLDGVCRDILTAARNPDWSEGPRICPDTAGRTPLDYAVSHDHVAVVKSLVSEFKLPESAMTTDQMSRSDLLATAISSQSVDISMHLIEQRWGLHFVTRSGKTVLHIAAEQGLAVVVEGLVAGTLVDINPQDTATGRTPLVFASIQGHAAVVETLLQAEADPRIPDSRGWLAKDYASYLGYPEIASAIKSPGSISLGAKLAKPIGATNILPRRSPTDSVIFISLGTQDLYKEVVEVDVTPYRNRISPVQLLDSELALTISLSGHQGDQEYRAALPVVSDTHEWPYCFTTRNPDSAVIVFRVIRTGQEKPIGTAVAALASLSQGLGPKRESLVRDFTIPLVSDETGHVGSIVFTLLIARPVKPGLVPPSEVQTLKQEPRTVLGGHRGNGQVLQQQKPR